VVPLPSKASTVSPKLLPSWAIYSFGYLSVIAPLWSLREANHLLWPWGRNGHRASDPLPVGERRRDRERPAPIRRRNNTARAAQFHLPFHPIIWKLFINNSFLSHTRAPGEEAERWGRHERISAAGEEAEAGRRGGCPSVDVCWILTRSRALTCTRIHIHTSSIVTGQGGIEKTVSPFSPPQQFTLLNRDSCFICHRPHTHTHTRTHTTTYAHNH